MKKYLLIIALALIVLMTSCSTIKSTYDPISGVELSLARGASNPEFSLVRYPDGSEKVMIDLCSDYRKEFGPITRILFWNEDGGRYEIPVNNDEVVYYGNTTHGTEYFLTFVEVTALVTPEEALAVNEVLYGGWAKARIYGDNGRWEEVPIYRDSLLTIENFMEYLEAR